MDLDRGSYFHEQQIHTKYKAFDISITTCTSETHSDFDSNNGCSWSCCSIKSKDTELHCKDGVSGTVMPNLQCIVQHLSLCVVCVCVCVCVCVRVCVCVVCGVCTHVYVCIVISSAHANLSVQVCKWACQS